MTTKAKAQANKARSELGALILTVAILVALGAAVLWGHETQKAHEDGITSGVDEPVDHSGAMALGAVAGVLFLSGVVVMASARPE